MADEVLRVEANDIVNEDNEVIARFEANNIIKFGGGVGGSGTSFSLDEVEVGTWLDGKALYEKSFQIDFNGDSGEFNLDVEALNIDTVMVNIAKTLIFKEADYTGESHANIYTGNNSYQFIITDLRPTGWGWYQLGGTWRGNGFTHALITILYTKTS